MYVELYFGNICNLNCSYCFDNCKRKKEIRIMNKKQIKKVICFLNSINVDTLEIIGGEPLIYKYLLNIINEVICNNVIIITNGLNESMLYKLSDIIDKNIKIVHSIHYEMYLKNKQKYITHLMNVCKLFNDKKNIDIEFAILIDKENTLKYFDLIKFIFDVCIDKFKYDFSVSYIRRQDSLKELMKNLLISRQLGKYGKIILDDLIEEKRISRLLINKNYMKKCPCFKNYIKIDIDGFLISSNCNIAKKSKKSIFDNDFNFKNEICDIICTEKHNINNGCCEKVLGI